MTNEEHYKELITPLLEKDTDDPFFVHMVGASLSIPMENALKDKYPFEFAPSPDSLPFLEYVVNQFPSDDAEILFYQIQSYVLTTKRDTLEEIKNNKSISLAMQLKKERDVNDYYSTAVEPLLYKMKGMLKEKYFRECKEQHPDISDSELRKYIKYYKKLKELARKHSTKYFQIELEKALNDGFSVNFIPNTGLNTVSILYLAVCELNDKSRENHLKKTTYKINLLLDNGAEVDYNTFRLICLNSGDMSLFERCLAKFPDGNQKQDDRTVLDEICYVYWYQGIPLDYPQVDEEFRTKIKRLLEAGAEPKDLERDEAYLKTRTFRQLKSYEILLKLIRTYQEQQRQLSQGPTEFWEYEL